MKKLLTISDLVKFCEINKFSKFSSKDTGYKISVQVPSAFESTESKSEDGLLRLKIKTSHTLKNRNGSFISEESAKEAMPSLKMRPVLAAIHQLDSGDWDFDSHNMEIVENEDGEEEINYIEKQVGAFTQEEPFLEYDEKEDKTYVCAYAVIPEEYTKAAEIIRRKGGTKVSCEILIDSFSYNAKEKYLDIEKYRYEGVTLLGTHKYSDGTEEEVGEGMLGSRADIEDFSAENNSVVSHTEINEQLVDTLEKLNSILQGFNINNAIFEKGGQTTVSKLEELLEKYGKTEEDLDFEVDGLSDDELESKFAEVFGEDNVEPAPEDSEGKGEEDPKDENNFSKTFSISHEDIRAALYELIAPYDEEDNAWYGINAVYDDHFVMQDWFSGNLYGCKYSVDGDNVSLDGERYKLFAEYLTESEKLALDDMRSNYSAIQEKLNKYEKAELDAQKDAIFEDASYAEYLETEEFKSLIADKDKYSVEELKDKAEIAFAKCVKKAGTFAAKNPEIKSKKHGLFMAEKTEKDSPYNGLFDD